MAVSANRLELLQIADAVAREKSIDREIVLAAMADAIQKAARSRYGQETNIRADINPKTGEIRLQRLLEVVETVEDYATQIALELARDRNPDAQLGDFIADPLPPMDFGRIAAQSAKQVIVQKVREAERDRQFDEFKDRIGEIVNGTVKRVEYGNVIVDLGRGEGIIRRDEMIPRENYPLWRPRSRLCLRRAPRAARPADLPVAHPSAVHGQAVHHGSAGNLRRHHRDQVGCPRSGLARQDRRDLQRFARSIRSAPASVCAARRVQAVVGELQGEKIDIIPWSPDAGLLHRQRAAAGGSRQGRARRGCRAHRSRGSRRPAVAGHRPPRPERAPRLAADRLGHRHPDRGRGIASAARRNSTSAPNLFMEALDVDEMVGQVLASEGFAQVEEVAYVELDEIASIDGFDDDTASEIQTRAREYLERIEAELDAKRKELGVADELRQIDGMTTADDGRARRGRHQDDRRLRRLRRPTIWSAGRERKDGETKKFEGLFSKLRRLARRGRAHGRPGPSGGRLDHRGGPARPRKSSEVEGEDGGSRSRSLRLRPDGRAARART